MSLQRKKERTKKEHRSATSRSDLAVIQLTTLVPSPTHDVDEKEKDEDDAKDDGHNDGRNDEQRFVAQC